MVVEKKPSMGLDIVRPGTAKITHRSAESLEGSGRGHGPSHSCHRKDTRA